MVASPTLAKARQFVSRCDGDLSLVGLSVTSATFVMGGMRCFAKKEDLEWDALSTELAHNFSCSLWDHARVVLYEADLNSPFLFFLRPSSEICPVLQFFRCRLLPVESGGYPRHDLDRCHFSIMEKWFSCTWLFQLTYQIPPPKRLQRWLGRISWQSCAKTRPATPPHLHQNLFLPSMREQKIPLVILFTEVLEKSSKNQWA